MNLIHQLTPLYTCKLFLFPKIITLCLDPLIFVQRFLLFFTPIIYPWMRLAYYLVVRCYQIFYIFKLYWQNFLNSCRHSIILLLRFSIHAGQAIMTWFIFYCHFLLKSSAWIVCMCTIRAMPFVLNWLFLFFCLMVIFFGGGGGTSGLKQCVQRMHGYPGIYWVCSTISHSPPQNPHPPAPSSRALIPLCMQKMLSEVPGKVDVYKNTHVVFNFL